MQLSINRELLLKGINLVAKASDKRHNMVVLGNIKLLLTKTQLTLIASDLEVELLVEIALPERACIQEGSITLPSNKFQDICKLLPANAMIDLTIDDNERCLIKSGKSRFTLGTLPASDFPTLGEPSDATVLRVDRDDLLSLIGKTQFAMAIQDVRYYLTGMLFEVSDQLLTTVATDGHRLALSKRAIEVAADLTMQAILPRKAVAELERLLNEQIKLSKQETSAALKLKFGREFLQVSLPFGVDTSGKISDEFMVTFTTRLIDGKFPDYRRVMPSGSDKQALVHKEAMLEVLRRVSILSNEKSKRVIFEFATDGMIEIKADNSEQDEAVERLESKYAGDAIELSFNAQYMQDVLDVLQGDIKIQMSQANASVLVNQHGDELNQYVIMPMRI